LKRKPWSATRAPLTAKRKPNEDRTGFFKTLAWTVHIKNKMREYQLSESRVRRVLHSPVRIEEGIAPKTTAFMQPIAYSKLPTRLSPGVWKQELWVMTEELKTKRKMISAWRYPGMTKPGVPLSPEVIRELRAMM
jgi:hypothetical protein